MVEEIGHLFGNFTAGGRDNTISGFEIMVSIRNNHQPAPNSEL
jgi:hypothetical protein